MEEKFDVRCYFQANHIKGNYYSFKILISGKQHKKLYKYMGRISINNRVYYRNEVLLKVYKILENTLRGVENKSINKIYIFTDDKKYLDIKKNKKVKNSKYEMVYLEYCRNILNYKKNIHRKKVNRKPRIKDKIKKNNYNIVFFDMEINFIRRGKGNYESIAIGAVFCDKKGNYKKAYHSLIKPENIGELNEFCLDIAKINEKMLKCAPSFNRVLEEFNTWCGREEVYFVSWGMNDIKVIKKDCLAKGVSKDVYNRIRHNYFNFQEEFMESIIKEKDNISLVNALKYYNLKFSGTEHNPKDDAYNLSRIYKKYMNN